MSSSSFYTATKMKCGVFQGPGPASGTNPPPQPFFNPQGIPPGYTPFGNPLQPGMLGQHAPPQQGQLVPKNSY